MNQMAKKLFKFRLSAFSVLLLLFRYVLMIMTSVLLTSATSERWSEWWVRSPSSLPPPSLRTSDTVGLTWRSRRLNKLQRRLTLMTSLWNFLMYDCLYDSAIPVLMNNSVHLLILTLLLLSRSLRLWLETEEPRWVEDRSRGLRSLEL